MMCERDDPSEKMWVRTLLSACVDTAPLRRQRIASGKLHFRLPEWGDPSGDARSGMPLQRLRSLAGDNADSSCRSTPLRRES